MRGFTFLSGNKLDSYKYFMEISEKKHYTSTSPCRPIIKIVKDGGKNRRGDTTEYIFSFLIAMI
jgi:hypothetical protein